MNKRRENNDEETRKYRNNKNKIKANKILI